MNLFASHPSVYTLPGTWEPQPDIVYDPTLIIAFGSLVFAIVTITSMLAIRRKRKRA